MSETLFASVDAGQYRFDYVIPIAILVVGASALVAMVAYAHWSARSTLLFGLFLFSCVVFRYAMVRTDEWHLSAGAQGSYLFLCALLSDAASLPTRVRVAKRTWRVPLVGLGFLLISLCAVRSVESDRGLSIRVARIMSGSEFPSPSQPYRYPRLRRVGDEQVPAETLRLVSYILKHTKPSEPIWVVSDFLDGGELYFLAERRNSTPYDTWSEVLTTREAKILLDSLKNDPPILILGRGWQEYEPEITDYVDAHWKPETTLEDIDIRRYDPGTGH
jgi:hypothetical protein